MTVDHLARWGTPWLRDPRDAPLLAHLLRASLLVPVAAALVVGPASWALPLTVLWAVVYLGCLERWITMFHDTSHRRLFRSPVLQAWLPGVVAPLYGSTWATYHAHHVLMHHPTDNGWDDLSSTQGYQRDRLGDFVRYYLRFFVCMPALSRFLWRRYPRRRDLALRVLAGELGWWALVLGLALVRPWAAVVVGVIPVLITRSLLILGNWGEHAFVDPDHPGDLWRSSADLRGPVNARAFNVGHHIAHHLRPGAHWSSLPGWAAAHAADYGAQDAIVLRELHYHQVCLLLLAGRYDRLADCFVRLPGAPERDRAEVIALLRHRVRAVPCG